jgi:CHRD domain
MSSVRRITIWLVASVGLLLACVVPASAAGRPFTVDLTGEAEVNAAGVPNQGDPNGSGTASLTINPGTGEVCWTIEVAEVDPIAAAHIHFAPSTAPGPIVVHLNPTSGCTELSRQLALAIITDPSSYYVNVHNASYPAGALRGQLAFAPDPGRCCPGKQFDRLQRG